MHPHSDRIMENLNKVRLQHPTKHPPPPPPTPFQKENQDPHDFFLCIQICKGDITSALVYTISLLFAVNQLYTDIATKGPQWQFYALLDNFHRKYIIGNTGITLGWAIVKFWENYAR